jgi:folate-dependent phosphoribosylglycinamide formyltransferase PurN
MRAVRTALICHHDNRLNRDVLPRWLASFSELAGIVVITETGARRRRRMQFEWRRSRWRMLDVFAFQLFYRLRLAATDREWVRARERELLDRYPPISSDVPIHHTNDPNDEDTRRFLASIGPDLVLARCKTLLRRDIFDIPRDGTIVLHPGICPEYRNAHGCFWALVRRDLERVGASMLRIDEGVDTGPIYAYYHADIDERAESHVVIQHRVVFDNLDQIAEDLKAVHDGRAQRIDVSGRESAGWGQPRLTDYLSWKRAAAR